MATTETIVTQRIVELSGGLFTRGVLAVALVGVGVSTIICSYLMAAVGTGVLVATLFFITLEVGEGFLVGVMVGVVEEIEVEGHHVDDAPLSRKSLIASL